MASAATNKENKQPEYLRQVFPKPSSPNPSWKHEIDLVFVHGLNPMSAPSFALSTWTHENGYFWPVAQLSKLIPTARILIFSYNSQVAWDVSSNGIQAHANSLLDRLSGARQNLPKEPRFVPIIFIAHSLGGLVVKQALVTAKNNDAYASIRLSTSSLVFFAVPHQGGHGAAMGVIAKNLVTSLTGNARNDLVESLKQNSMFQENQAEMFRHQLEDYSVLSFCEGRPTMYKGLRGLLRSATSLIVVDRKSATLGLAGTREQILIIDADHTHVCKFEGEDDMSEPVRRGMSKVATVAIEKASELQAEAARSSGAALGTKHLEFIRKNLPTGSNIDHVHNSILKSRCDGTAEWMFQREIFTAWAADPSGRMWIKGKAGCGKSVLAANLVSRLQSLKGPSTSTSTVLFFFCSILYPQSLKFPEFVRSLVLQLVQALPFDSPALQEAYALTSRSPSWVDEPHSLQKFFESAVRQVSSLKIVLDGIDECDHVTDLIEFLSFICSQSGPGLKLAIFARSGSEVEEALVSYFPKVYEIISSDVFTDISIFVDAEMHRRKSLGAVRRLKIRDPELEKQVKDTIERGADGMFLWAACQIDEICKQRSDAAVEKAVQNLPQGLQNTYERMVHRISCLPKGDQDIALKCLCWIFSARRLLRLTELAAIVTLDEDVRRWTPAHALTDPAEVIELCSGFVTQTAGNVHFIHASAKQFLASNQDHKPSLTHDASLVVLRSCMQLICLENVDEFEAFEFKNPRIDSKPIGRRSEFWDFMQESPSKEPESKLSPERAMLSYAVQQWPWHAKLCQDQALDYHSLVLQLVAQEELWRTWLCHWMRTSPQRFDPLRLDAITAVYQFGDHQLPSWNASNENLGLFADDPFRFTSTDEMAVLAFLGLHQCIGSAISNGLTQPIPGSFLCGIHPIHGAAAGNQVETISWLLKNGANVDVEDDLGRTPLHLAAMTGEEVMIEVLTEHQASIEKVDILGLAPIHYLAMQGKPITSPIKIQNIVKTLDSSGELRNLVGPLNEERYDFILEMVRNDKRLPRSLVAQGFVPGMGGNVSGFSRLLIETMLQYGSEMGIEVIGFPPKSLHMYRTDISIDEELQLTACGTPGDTTYYRPVLTETTRNIARTPFMHAIYSNQIELALLLIDRGADPNVLDANGRPACHVLARRSSNGQDLDLQHWARLNRAGMSLFSEDEQGRTALYHAVATGQIELVKYLIDEGVQIDHQDLDGRTACHYLADAGALLDGDNLINSLTRLLLSHRPRLDIAAKEGLTAMMLAISNRWASGAMAFLAAGAPPPTAEKATAVLWELLHDMLQKPNAKEPLPVQLLELLLGFGAEMKSLCVKGTDDSDLLPILSFAVYHQHVPMVEFLASHGADVHVLGYGLTPIWLALASPSVKDNRKRMAMLKALLKAGADPEDLRQGNTPMFYLFTTMDPAHHDDIVSLLISHGADVELRIPKCFSLTQYVAECFRDCKDTMRLLLEAPRPSKMRTQDDLALLLNEPGALYRQIPEDSFAAESGPQRFHERFRIHRYPHRRPELTYFDSHDISTHATVATCAL